MSNKNCDLTCVLDRYENSKAVLRFDFSKEDHQELIVAKRYLPKDIEEGDVLCIEMYSDKGAEIRKRNLARHVLDEILNGN